MNQQLVFTADPLAADPGIVAAQAALTDFDQQVATMQAELAELQRHISDSWDTPAADRAATKAAKLRVQIDAAPGRRTALEEALQQARIDYLKDQYRVASERVRQAQADFQNRDRLLAITQETLKTAEKVRYAALQAVHNRQGEARQVIEQLQQLGLDQAALRDLQSNDQKGSNDE